MASIVGNLKSSHLLERRDGRVVVAQKGALIRRHAGAR